MLLFYSTINLKHNSYTHTYIHKRTFHGEMNFQGKCLGRPEVFKTRLPKIHVIWDLTQGRPVIMYQSITSNILENLKVCESSYPVFYNPVSFIMKNIELWQHRTVFQVHFCVHVPVSCILSALQHLTPSHTIKEHVRFVLLFKFLQPGSRIWGTREIFRENCHYGNLGGSGTRYRIIGKIEL